MGIAINNKKLGGMVINNKKVGGMAIAGKKMFSVGQKIALPASAFAKFSNGGSWRFETNRPLIDAKFATGAYLHLISLQQAGRVEQLFINLHNQASGGVNVSKDFNDDFEMNGSIKLTLSTGESISVNMSDQRDDTDPYEFDVSQDQNAAFIALRMVLQAAAAGTVSAELQLKGGSTTPTPTGARHSFTTTVGVPTSPSGIQRGAVTGRGGTFSDATYNTPDGTGVTINFIGIVDANTLRFGFAGNVAQGQFPKRIKVTNGTNVAEYDTPTGYAIRGLGSQMDYARKTGDSGRVWANNATITVELFDS